MTRLRNSCIADAEWEQAFVGRVMSGRSLLDSLAGRRRSGRASPIAAIVCLAPLLQACVLAESRLALPEPQSAPPDEPAIERAVKSVFQQVKLTGMPEVSELRQAFVSAPADWLVCVRSNVPPFRPYAMFFEVIEHEGRRQPRFAFVG